MSYAAVKLKLLAEDIVTPEGKVVQASQFIPKYTTEGSAAMDVRAYISEPIQLYPKQTMLIPLGFAFSIENKSVAAKLLPRSGLGHKYGIILGNGTGLIDSDYQKQVYASLWNRNNQGSPFTINPGDRIAQLLFMPILQAEFDLEEVFADITPHNGFGSTGVQ